MCHPLSACRLHELYTECVKRTVTPSSFKASYNQVRRATGGLAYLTRYTLNPTAYNGDHVKNAAMIDNVEHEPR